MFHIPLDLRMSTAIWVYVHTILHYRDEAAIVYEASLDRNGMHYNSICTIMSKRITKPSCLVMARKLRKKPTKLLHDYQTPITPYDNPSSNDEFR